MSKEARNRKKSERQERQWRKLQLQQFQTLSRIYPALKLKNKSRIEFKYLEDETNDLRGLSITHFEIDEF